MFSKSFLILLSLVAFALCSPACNDAETVDSPNQAIVGTLIDAEINGTSSTINFDFAACVEIDTSRNNAFYTFNSEAMNHIMIDHCNVLGHHANVDPISVVIFSGDCDNLVCVAAYADLCGEYGGEFGVNLEQHTEYFIGVYGPAVDFIFDTRLSFSLKNDQCENGIEVHEGQLYSSSSAHATIDGSTFCFVPSANVWYSFTTTEADAYVLISFCRFGADTIYDNFISLMRGDDCNSGSCVAFDDNSCGLAPELFVPVEPNTRYFFEIGTKGIKGEFTFYFDSLPTNQLEDTFVEPL